MCQPGGKLAETLERQLIGSLGYTINPQPQSMHFASAGYSGLNTSFIPQYQQGANEPRYNTYQQPLQPLQPAQPPQQGYTNPFQHPQPMRPAGYPPQRNRNPPPTNFSAPLSPYSHPPSNHSAIARQNIESHIANHIAQNRANEAEQARKLHRQHRREPAMLSTL